MTQSRDRTTKTANHQGPKTTSSKSSDDGKTPGKRASRADGAVRQSQPEEKPGLAPLRSKSASKMAG